MASSFSLSKRPDCEKCPAPMSHLNSTKLLLALAALSLATNFAGSQSVQQQISQIQAHSRQVQTSYKQSI